MENLERNTIAKKIIAILLVLATLLSYIPVSIFAANDVYDNGNGVGVIFDAKWSSNEDLEEGTTEDTLGADYSFTLNGAQTGFQNVQLLLETDEAIGANDKITIKGTTGASSQITYGKGYAAVNFGNLNQGQEIGGQISVKFYNEEQVTRKLTLTLTGSYIDPVQGITKNINIKKELEAIITPATIITPYMADMAWQDYYENGQTKYRTPVIEANKITIKDEYENNIGFYTDYLDATYPVKIYSKEKTQELKLEIKIDRYSSDGTKRLSEGYTIDWGGLTTDFGQPTLTNNDDGSITYTFIKGSDNGTYNSTTAFDINKSYDVKIRYTTSNTDPRESDSEFRTFVNFESNLSTVGYKLEKIYNQQETAQRVTENKKLVDLKGVNVQSYTPGKNAWISVSADSSKIDNTSKITEDVRTKLKNGETVNVNANIDIRFINGIKSANEIGNINVARPRLVYISDDSKVEALNLDASLMKIKTITKSDLNMYDSEYVENSIATPFDDTYTATNDTNVFTIRLNDFDSAEKYNASYNLVYELNLAEAGLTATEIENIQNLVINFKTSGSQFISGQDSFILSREVVKVENQYSYMEMQLVGSHDETTEQLNKKVDKTLKLKMYRNNTVIKDTSTSRNNVRNENPVFYVEFPESGTRFVYDIDPDDITITSSENIQIDEENMDLITIDNSDYLVIPCIGVYDNKLDEEVDITIPYSRTLLDASNSKTYINTYMLTDNENYFYESRNYNEFSKLDGTESDVAFLATGSFNVVGINKLEAKTEITNEKHTYLPNPSDGINNDRTEKELPLIVNSNSTVTYESRISSQNDEIKDVTILSRLPIANNTFIEAPTSQIIENDFELPQEYYNNYGSKLNGITQGAPVTQTSLTNLNILGVYKVRASLFQYTEETQLEDSQYKVYYTTDANATFDSASFVEYVPGGVNTDFANAKNIKVVITDTNEKLLSGESYVVKYEMTMPDQAGMVGAQTAVKYTKVSDSSVNNLYSPAAYIINGDENITINVQKIFENYGAGIAPAEYGVNSLAGIDFKLQYYNPESKQREFVKNLNSNDMVATTDSTGKATFTGIPEGRYYLYEVNDFDQYSGIGNVNIINASTGETVNYIAENKLKRGNIVINKTWQGATESQGQVTFNVARLNANNETFEFIPVTVTTDSNDQAFLLNLPYGRYSITESSGQVAWTPEEMNKNVVLDNDEVSVTYNNVPAKATLQIVKTVPGNETVDGLSFLVTGRGAIEKQDTINFDVNSSIAFKIGAENNPSNVSIVKSENDTVATITITDLYLGYYTIKEVDIPDIQGAEGVAQYSGVADSAILTSNGETKVVNLVNNHQYGKIVIEKTAKLKDGANLYSISDLSGFQIQITGHSYYAPSTQINEVLTTDEDGHAEIELEVGQYKITELPAEGYNTYYGENSSATQTPPDVTLTQNNQVVTQKIYNEHTGVGYVKVIKSLDGVTSPQEVVDKHIKFAVVGRNVAQEKIGGVIEGTLQGELIEINQIDAVNNVAYGISGPISINGDYELQEVPSSIPDFYEAYEPTTIQVTSANTVDNPNVVTVVNEKSRGNLEIITTTNPEGGPLTEIQYKVTPVKINSDATYTATGAAQVVDGSNDPSNASFAKLENIYAGFYAVEQIPESIPDGWKSDVKQIVEVPGNNTGYANFEIMQKKQIRTNKVTIKKELLNMDGETATSDDIENAELNVDEKFEVKLTNVATNEEYYVFTSVAEPGVITGLDIGTYRIEEVYKPKYNTLGYYKEVTELDVNEQPQVVKYSLDTMNNTFTVSEESGNIKDVVLVIDNRINTDFGFGGQDSKENLSKTTIEEEEEILVTKSVIYVTDEENKKISGVKFSLYNSENKLVTLNKLGSEFEINDYKLIIKGLPVGKYTLKCTQYPEGYLKPDDKEVIVYNDATQVVRVEVQKNIPRGNLTLSTIYTKNNGDTRYLSTSEYKVVDSATGELVKFVRTPSGSYKKSNTSEASPVVTLKAAPVELQGLELGDYEVGIVGVKTGYGIIKEEPEYVTVEENTNKNVVTNVVNKSVVHVGGHGATTMYTDSNGDLYYIGYVNGNNGNSFDTNTFKKVEFYEDAKITKFSYINNYGTLRVLAIDDQGQVWAYGPGSQVLGLTTSGNINNTASFGNAMPGVCITKNGDLRYAYNEGARFVDVQVCGQYASLALDDQGRVWIMGLSCCDGNGNNYVTFAAKPIQPFIDNNVKIAKLARCGTLYNSNQAMGAVDTEGKVWIWGGNTYSIDPSGEYNVFTPKCLSDSTPLGDVKIVDLIIKDQVAMALDENGEVWIWGTYSNLQSTVQGGTTTKTPTKIAKSYFNGKKISAINMEITYSSDFMAAVIDEDGKVWTWGYQYRGELGQGPNASYKVSTPTCISDESTEVLYGKEIKELAIAGGVSSYYPNNTNGYVCHVIAVDTDNNMWAWGGNSYCGEAGLTIESDRGGVNTPQRLYSIYNEHLEYNLKFEKIYGMSGDTYAIDSEGRLWVWGRNGGCELGVQPQGTVSTPKVVELPGNPRVAKAVNNGSNMGLILTEDGRVFATGYEIYFGNGKYTSGYTPFIEITSFCPPAVKDIDLMDRVYVVLDEYGQVWTWGGSSGPIGRSSNKYTKEMILSGIQKVSGGYNVALALTNDGKVYTWSSSNKPVLRESSRTFVDVCGLYAKDSDGYLWYWDNSKFIQVYGPEVSLYNTVSEGNPDYRIVDMYDQYNSYGDEIFIKDSNGDVWLTYYEETLKKCDIGITDVKMMSYEYLVDYSGQIWKYNTTDYSVSSMMEDTKVKNPYYGYKFKHLYNTSNYSACITDIEGSMYSENDMSVTTANATKYNTDVPDYLDEVKGKKVTQSFLDCYLDEDKHVWWKQSNSEYPICLNDEGNALNNVSIEKIFTFEYDSSYTNYTYFAQDSNGNLWAWGANNVGQLANNTTNSNKYNNPVKITGIGTIEEFKTDGNYCIVKNTDNEYWAWGYNTNGVLGNGNTNSITTPYKINITDKQIIDINIFGSTCGLLLCSDGSLYASNTSSSTRAWLKIGDCDGATSILDTKLNNNYVITGANKIWILSGTTLTLVAEDKEAKMTAYLNVNGSKKYGIVDTTGKFWIYDNNAGTLTLDETKDNIVCLVKAYNTTAINNEGYICGLAGDDIDVSYIIKDMFGTLSEETINKYAQLIKNNNSSLGGTEFILLDGKLWKYKYDSYGVIISYTCFNNWTVGDINGKTIVDYSQSHAIDSEGRLYELTTGRDLTKDEYNVTQAAFNANNNVINVVRKNPTYGTKFIDVSNDIFATDYNNHVWYFPVSGDAVDISKANKGSLNPLYGKQLKKMLNNKYLVTTDNEVWRIDGELPKYVMKTIDDSQYTVLTSSFEDLGSEYIVALDTNGKIWVAGNGNKLGIESLTTNGEVVCLNDIEGSSFHNVVVSKAVYTDGKIFAIDNNGKVWAWGTNKYTTPTCLTDIATGDLHTAYEGGVAAVDFYNKMTFDTGSERMLIKDSNDELWYYSSSTNVNSFVRFNADVIIGQGANETIKDAVIGARLMNNGKLYFRYPKGTSTYDSYSFRFSNINELVTSANVPAVTDIFNGYVYERSSMSTTQQSTVTTLANTANGVYVLKATYSRSSSYNNYAATVTHPSTSNIVKTVKCNDIDDQKNIFLDENGELWVSGKKGRLFNNTNTFSSDIVDYECITTNANSPLYGVKFSNIEKYGQTVIGTEKTTNTLYFITSYSADASPKVLNNDDAVRTLYGEENVDNEHRTKIFTEPEIVYNNGKYYTVQNDMTVTEVERDYIEHYIDGVGIIDEIIGEYDFVNTDGIMYRIVPSGTTTYDIVKITEPMEFTTKTPDEAIEVEGATIVKQVKHKALDSNGNLYVWDTHTGLIKDTEGVVCLTEIVNSVDPEYNLNDNGWTVIKTQK